MLINVNVTNTLPIEKMKNLKKFRCPRRVRWRRKRTEEGRNKQTCALVPKIFSMRKEEGATVAATYLLSGETVRAGLVRAERAAILHGDLTL